MDHTPNSQKYFAKDRAFSAKDTLKRPERSQSFANLPLVNHGKVLSELKKPKTAASQRKSYLSSARKYNASSSSLKQNMYIPGGDNF